MKRLIARVFNLLFKKNGEYQKQRQIVKPKPVKLYKSNNFRRSIL